MVKKTDKARKNPPSYTLRDLPAEWTEYQVIAKRQGTSAADLLRRHIIDTVNKETEGQK